MTCDACGKKIKADTAAITVNTTETSNHWHLACCPYVREASAGKEKAAA